MLKKHVYSFLSVVLVLLLIFSCDTSITERSKVNENEGRDEIQNTYDLTTEEGLLQAAKDDDFVNQLIEESETNVLMKDGSSLGDVDSNGMIDIVDALLTAQYYVGQDPANFDTSVADVDASEAIDIVDALLIAQYYVGIITIFPGEIITFPDPEVELIVRNKVHKLNDYEIIYYKDVKDVIQLNLDNPRIQDLTGVEYFHSLEDFTIDSDYTVDLSPIQNLTTLRLLRISNNEMTDLNILQNLTSLEMLDASFNQIVDLTPLKNCISMDYLYLDDNQIQSLNGLEDMAVLRILYARNNQIEDISALANLDSLTLIWLRNNRINNLTGLESPKSLEVMGLSNNLIEDISILVSNPAIGEGDLVELNENNLIDQENNIQILTDRGAVVKIDE